MNLAVTKMRVSLHIVCIVLCIVRIRCSLRKDADYWRKLATDELEEALTLKWNTGTAKNVILFIGDGMGPNTVTATRIYQGGETHKLVYERFPHIGMLKTYSANTMVPDSASTSTALLCGIKTNHNTVGVDATVEHYNCSASLEPQARLKSLAALALSAGKSTECVPVPRTRSCTQGKRFVTTMRVTHATPAPMYGHSAARQWECDGNMPDNTACKDIARQLVEDWPGRDLHVILGGGRQGLIPNATSTPSDPTSSWSCSRKDGRDLIEAYRKDKEERALKYSVVSNYGELQNLNVEETDYLLGIFANGHLKYESEKSMDPEGMPSIVNMTEAAIKVLRKNPNGFFLMVEGGNIDMAHHRGRAKQAVDESAAMERAVARALDMTDERETLVVVTSDHTHSLTINGYPKRGANIFGTTGPSRHDGLNYTTLAYGTGGPGSFKYKIDDRNNESHIVRPDPSTEDTDDFYYEQIAAITLDENAHGGGDVVVYAKGPYAHLFHNIHEQNYVYHVISYAAKLGPYSNSVSDLQKNLTIFLLLIPVLFLREFYISIENP